MECPVNHKDEMKRLLTNDEVIQIAGPGTRVVTYDIFKHINDISEAFRGGTKALIVLYRKSETVGHWVALIKQNPHLYEYYDGYGYEIDHPLKFFPDNNKKLGQEEKYLSQLLLKFLEKDKKNKVVYNEYKYQGIKEKNSATCGRYVGFRIRNKKMPLNKYQAYFNKLKKETDPDEFIIDMTQNFL